MESNSTGKDRHELDASSRGLEFPSFITADSDGLSYPSAAEFANERGKGDRGVDTGRRDTENCGGRKGEHGRSSDNGSRA